MTYTYVDVDQKEIEHIRQLWEENRDFHEKTSEFFSTEYKSLQFSDRMQAIFSNDEIQSKITVAVDSNDTAVGYCLSTLDHLAGEICTLYVKENYRNHGIGKILLEKHLEWLQSRDCQEISVHVLPENKKAIRFYERIGFQQNTIHMKMPHTATRGAERLINDNLQQKNKRS